jgi:hypothetical protein
MVADVPFELDHAKVVDWPELIFVSEAVKLLMVGSWITLTCTVRVSLPVLLVTVNV